VTSFTTARFRESPRLPPSHAQTIGLSECLHAPVTYFCPIRQKQTVIENYSIARKRYRR
jgi:hypothetical protein